jgi:hypothetical protein
MLNDDCEHIIQGNICTKCNLVIDNYFDKKYSSIDDKKDNTKYNMIDQLKHIPPEIIKLTKKNIINHQNKTGEKIRNDAKQTFIQVYKAIVESGSNLNPSIITKQLGLGKKEINWCLKEITKTSLIPSIDDGLEEINSINLVHPVARIEELCIKNDIVKYTEELKILTKKIIDEKEALLDHKPYYIACGIIRKFCIMKNINIKSFSKHNDISDNALKKAISKIEEFF